MTKRNNKQTTIRITLLAMFTAIIAAMTFTPYIGYITIPSMLSITTIHIIVVIAAIVMNNFIDGAIIGAVWGITCLLYAMYNGTADAAIFLDPKISIVPRILVGVLIVAFYRLSLLASKNKILNATFKTIVMLTFGLFAAVLAHNISNLIVVAIIVGVLVVAFCSYLFFVYGKKSETMPYFFAALGGTFSNTILVLTAINLFASQGLINLTGTIKSIYSVVIALNGSIEIVAAVIIAVPCAFAVTKAIKKINK
ncbi:MAG: hypothetical protein IKU82_07125 [Clostridia bacterium]|nr:hypothetical protein [Clostridia bacterium]